MEMVADASGGRVASVRLEINNLEVRSEECLMSRCLVGLLCDAIILQGEWKTSKAVGTGEYEDLPCSMVS